ncbi:phosphohydrolase [Thioclava sp. GXIMD4216]|uniref:Phosphohydrolase n=1 Tax=Thioclava litoralis TaxID=3076557 RepID=A0ABZ1DYM1_9RHOB|nr:phosphohydrolase [Thioclava sp. FTW29]
MQLETAIRIAALAHKGQTDKGGAPYILHPLRVMLGAKDHDSRVVAVLHDVVEDSDWTLAALRIEGLSDLQATALDALSKRMGEPYEAFVLRAAAHPIARVVKRLDLLDNLDLSRIAHIGPEDRQRIARYHAALKMLDQSGDRP